MFTTANECLTDTQSTLEFVAVNHLKLTTHLRYINYIACNTSLLSDISALCGTKFSRSSETQKPYRVMTCLKLSTLLLFLFN